MSLDLHKAVTQIRGMAAGLKKHREAQDEKLGRALYHLTSANPQELEGRRREGKFTWLVAGMQTSMAGRYQATPLPYDYLTLAVDGSHIDVERHLAARCSLINIGRVLLRYGSQPEAWLDNEPRLYTEDDGLILEDPDGVRDQTIDGQLLGIKRSVEEIRALADLASEAPQTLPTVALLDGSLALWGLTGQVYPEFVRRVLLKENLLPSLNALRQQARKRPLAVASYVSLPRATDVVGALRLAECPYPMVNCDHHCRGLRTGHRPCDVAALGVTDQDIFSSLLAPGERSDNFRSTSSVVEQYYGDHSLYFFYLNVGHEIARVEMPAWTATDNNLVNLLHATLLAQCEKGQGYPVALSEAHEQAVVTGSDREHFRILVEQALEGQHLPTYTSEKARSKRLKLV